MAGNRWQYVAAHMDGCVLGEHLGYIILVLANVQHHHIILVVTTYVVYK